MEIGFFDHPTCYPLIYYPSVMWALSTWVSSLFLPWELASDALLCGMSIAKVVFEVARIVCFIVA